MLPFTPARLTHARVQAATAPKGTHRTLCLLGLVVGVCVYFFFIGYLLLTGIRSCQAEARDELPADGADESLLEPPRQGGERGAGQQRGRSLWGGATGEGAEEGGRGVQDARARQEHAHLEPLLTEG